jgi:hypothetical protein
MMADMDQERRRRHRVRKGCIAVARARKSDYV